MREYFFTPSDSTRGGGWSSSPTFYEQLFLAISFRQKKMQTQNGKHKKALRRHTIVIIGEIGYRFCERLFLTQYQVLYSSNI